MCGVWARQPRRVPAAELNGALDARADRAADAHAQRPRRVPRAPPGRAHRERAQLPLVRSRSSLLLLLLLLVFDTVAYGYRALKFLISCLRIVPSPSRPRAL